MDLDAYFARIAYDGFRDASAEALAAIARCHAMAIPFENLSVLASGPPDLALDALEDKLVRRGRGGYCYEQNHLLLAALQELGFAVEALSARVRFGLPPGTPTPRSHMVLRVRTDAGPRLVDAGFGRYTLTAPVDLGTDAPQPTPHETIRAVAAGDGFLLQIHTGTEWRDLYSFDLVPQLHVDYLQQNWYTATRPGALFANNVVVTRPASGGRHVLFNRTLRWRSNEGQEASTPIRSPAELRDALAATFGLSIDDAELAAAWGAGSRGQDAHAMFV